MSSSNKTKKNLRSKVKRMRGGSFRSLSHKKVSTVFLNNNSSSMKVYTEEELKAYTQNLTELLFNNINITKVARGSLEIEISRDWTDFFELKHNRLGNSPKPKKLLIDVLNSGLKNERNQTPLYVACRYADIETIKYLLNCEDVNWKRIIDDVSGDNLSTAAIGAAYGNKPIYQAIEILFLLKQKGANLMIPTININEDEEPENIFTHIVEKIKTELEIM